MHKQLPAIAFVLLITLMSGVAATAQPVVRTAAIATAGHSSTALPGLVIESTVGEIAIATVGSNPSCTQGMHQPNTIQVDFATDNRFAIIYPNPVQTTLQVKLYVEENSTILFTLYNAAGQQVAHRAKSYMPGQHVEQFQLTGYKQGLYMISIKDPANDKKLLVKLVKL